MTTLPIPFFTCLLLLILAGANHHQLKATPTGKLVAVFLYANAVVALCIGFRWSHDLIILLPIAAALAVVSTAVLYLAFCSLGRYGPVVKPARDWPHLIPLCLILAAAAIQPTLIEIPLIVTKFVYAGLMIALARHAPGTLQLVRLAWLSNTQHALWGAAIVLLMSAGIDIAIALDFAYYEGRHAAGLVGFANLVAVSLLGWASVLAGRAMSSLEQTNHSSLTAGAIHKQANAIDVASIEANNVAPMAADSSDTLEAINEDPSENDALLLQQLEHLLIDQKLYADTELNLQKLARKAGVPARAVSRAINSHTGKNVSQWVNSARVNAVCEQLNDQDVTVTQAMMDAGFLTKSNFNREFRRIKGCSPSEWRSLNG